MKIHEYQAKNILKKYGVAVPRGEMVETREAAEAAAKKIFDSGVTGVVVKAQIHAGGRGKGGGVKIAKSVAEAAELAGKILGMTLVTHQTGPEGRVVRGVRLPGFAGLGVVTRDRRRGLRAHISSRGRSAGTLHHLA